MTKTQGKHLTPRHAVKLLPVCVFHGLPKVNPELLPIPAPPTLQEEQSKQEVFVAVPGTWLKRDTNVVTSRQVSETKPINVVLCINDVRLRVAQLRGV